MYSGVPIHWPMRVTRSTVGQRLADGLGDAEVDDLRDRLIGLSCHQNVRGLEVAVNDALLVCVLHASADVEEELDAVLSREALVVAVLGQRLAPDQLHDEVGTAGRGDAGVEDARDVAVVHAGERLSLGVEAGEHLLAVHTQLDQLEGHLAAHRLELLGTPDLAHAASAELLEQLVRPDPALDLGAFDGVGEVFEEGSLQGSARYEKAVVVLDFEVQRRQKARVVPDLAV